MAPDGGVTTLVYSSGLLSEIVEPGSRTLTIAHDGSGNLTSVVDAAGFSQSFAYDSTHRMIGDQLSPTVTSFTYDSVAGKLASVNQGLGSVTYIVPASIWAVLQAPWP